MRFLPLILLAASAQPVFAAPAVRVRFPEISERWFERGGMLAIPKAPVTLIEAELRGRGFDRINPGRLHLMVNGAPVEVQVFTTKEALAISSLPLPVGQFFPGEERHEVEVYVSDTDFRQKWVISRGSESIIIENAGSRGGVLLRIELLPESRTIALWDREQSADVEIKGVIKPADRLQKFVVAGLEQAVDPTLQEMPFAVKVRITSETPDIALEASDPQAYVRVLVPVRKQGRRK